MSETAGAPDFSEGVSPRFVKAQRDPEGTRVAIERWLRGRLERPVQVSGLDIPTANTMVVSRADMFGDIFMDEFSQITRPDPEALDKALKRYDIAWTIMPPEAGVNAMIAASPAKR